MKILIILSIMATLELLLLKAIIFTKMETSENILTEDYH